MPIDYQRLREWRFPDVVQTYGPREVMAYALSLGAGSDPLDAARLPFVFEGAPGGLRVLPTFALVLGYPGFWMSDPASGIDAARLVHGENGLTIHRPLPGAATVVGRSRVTRIVDKGPGRGAVVTVERTISDADSGTQYATIRHVTFCRGDGGFATSEQPGDEPGPALPKVPGAGPALSDPHMTRPDAALLYRLHADPNPLHADPGVAKAAGFDRPILHGLASYGMAALSVIRHCCGGRPERFRSLDLRFTAPMFPGETLEVDLWPDRGRVQLRGRVSPRGVTVLDCGIAEIE
ncbi:MaoC family dehydratase [Variovorax defluvii]|uniref:MaoC family dehydratase n=1 Tax=Variovorax defluvii TaxID=913761 RepID=A0ABP8GX43_9BURK